MKIWRFVLFLFKHGSIRGIYIDFEHRRAEIFKSAPVQLKPLNKNMYVRLRDKFIKGRYAVSLISAIAYLKSIPKIHRQYFVVTSLQLVYVRIFKAGSTSILKQILPLIDPNLKNKNFTDRQIDEFGNQYVRHALGLHETRYEYFTVVRNPFHRLVSVYLDLFDPHHPFVYQTYLFGILKKEMTFGEFVQTLYHIPETLKSSHFIPQSYIVKLCGREKRIKCFRLEKDRLALETFLQQYGMAINHNNKRKMDYDYRSYYDMNTLQMAYAMYQADVEMFDYTEEYKLLNDEVQRIK